MSKHHRGRSDWKAIISTGRPGGSPVRPRAHDEEEGRHAHVQSQRPQRGRRAERGPRPEQAARTEPGAHARRDQRPTRGQRPIRGQRPERAGRRGEPDRGKPSASAPGKPRVFLKPAIAKVRPPQLDGQGLPYITLAQFLKKLDLVGSGGAAKAMVRAGGMTVNDVAEVRPGRKLHHGDVVKVGGAEHRVAINVG